MPSLDTSFKYPSFGPLLKRTRRWLKEKKKHTLARHPTTRKGFPQQHTAPKVCQDETTPFQRPGLNENEESHFSGTPVLAGRRGCAVGVHDDHVPRHLKGISCLTVGKLGARYFPCFCVFFVERGCPHVPNPTSTVDRWEFWHHYGHRYGQGREIHFQRVPTTTAHGHHRSTPETGAGPPFPLQTPASERKLGLEY